MTRPKKDSSAKRVIMDLSFPPGHSVNAGIHRGYYQSEQFNFTLPLVALLTDRLTQLGPNAWLWSADLARAYRQLRVCPLSVPLLGIPLDNQYFLDISLTFWCRTSALACACTTRAVVWLLRKEGYFSICYLNDFVMLELTKQKAETAYARFLDLAAKLGLDLAPTKCSPPTAELVWLGYRIDTKTMTVFLPPEKVAEVLTDCNAWKSKSSATRKQLQSLNHLSKCI